MNLLNGVITLLDVSARQKGLELSLTIEPDLPEILKGDVRQLRHILLNLLGNAVKFTDHGAVTLEVKEYTIVSQSKFLLL